jgi:hypothetical protein
MRKAGRIAEASPISDLSGQSDPAVIRLAFQAAMWQTSIHVVMMLPIVG